MRNKITDNSNGYIALLLVLVVGAISLATSLALITSGVNSQKTIRVTEQSVVNRGLAGACIEEALQQMYSNTSYSGSGNVTLGGLSCSYVVTKTGRSSRIITSETTVSSVTRKIKVYAIINPSSISIASWKEVGDL